MLLQNGNWILFEGNRKMAYRKDEDLEFLQHCSDKDLSPLVEILTKRSDGDEGLTEELTMHERYKEHEPSHQKYWDLIAAEIQCFGANTFATIGRGGKGVRYREILIDVCKRLKVKCDFDYSVYEIERALIVQFMEDAIERMTPEELADAIRELELETPDLSKQAAIAAIQAAARSGGFFTYRLSLIVANAVAKKVLGHGLTLAANVGLVRGVSVLTGPIGFMLTTVWSLVEIAGPAFRKTRPAVIFVAMLRQHHEREKDANRSSPGKIDPSKRQHVVVVEDGGVSEMEAVLRRERQKEVQVLSESQAPHLKFGDEPIQKSALYTIHPLTQDIYFRQALIRQRLFEERVLEAVSILEAMGAKHVRIESERALTAATAAEGSIKRNPVNIEAHGEIEAKEKKKILYDVKRSAPRDRAPFDESMLQRSVWYKNDPFFRQLRDSLPTRRGFFRQLLDSLPRRGIEEITFEREFDQETRVYGKLELGVLERLGISVSGESKDHQTEKFSAFAEF